MDVYPDNTAAQYTIKLAQRIELGEGEWSVSLKEISTPQSFINLKCDVYKFQMKNTRNQSIELMVPGALYRTRETLLLKLNRMTRDYDVSFRLPGQGNNRKVTVVVGNTHTFRPNRQLSSLLGFGRQERDYPQGQYEAANAMTLPRQLKIHNLYVYCDILENVIVGDYTAPLLRIVEVGVDSKKALTHTIINSPLFVPIQKKSFDTINIWIMTNTGEPAPFGTGKSHVVLELKKSGLLDSLV